MAVGPIFGSFGAISPILDYLRPRRSPYLIPAAVIAFLLGRRVLGLDGAPTPADFGLSELLFYGPVVVIFALLAILSLLYQDPTLSRPSEDPDGKFDDKLIDEIDSQLKFSRAMGVAVGVAALYYLLALFPHQMMQFPTSVLYVVVLVHLLTFLAYMALYNIREESPNAHAFFQIGALMSITLVVLTLAVPLIDMSDGQLATRCETTYDVKFSGRPIDDSLTDADGNSRDATPKEIAAMPVKTGELQVTVPGCGATAEPISAGYLNAYPDGFSVTSATLVGTPTHIDEHFVVASCFLAIWLVFEAFWLRFLSKVIRVSVTVFDDSARKTAAAKTRRRRPSA